MFLLKIVTVIALGFITLAMAKLVMGALHVAKVRVRAESHPRQAKAVTRLAQDPRTGIYYPET